MKHYERWYFPAVRLLIEVNSLDTFAPTEAESNKSDLLTYFTSLLPVKHGERNPRSSTDITTLHLAKQPSPSTKDLQLNLASS